MAKRMAITDKHKHPQNAGDNRGGAGSEKWKPCHCDGNVSCPAAGGQQQVTQKKKITI
jgi:hypothetical protein